VNGWSIVLLFIAVGLLSWYLGRRSRGRIPVVVARLCAVVPLVGGLYFLGAGLLMLRHEFDWSRGYLRIIYGAGFIASGILGLMMPLKGSVNDRQSQDH